MVVLCSCFLMCFEIFLLELVVDICDVGEFLFVCNFVIFEMGVGGEISVVDDFVGLLVWVLGDNWCFVKDEEIFNYGLSLVFGVVIDIVCDLYFELGSIY